MNMEDLKKFLEELEKEVNEIFYNKDKNQNSMNELDMLYGTDKNHENNESKIKENYEKQIREYKYQTNDLKCQLNKLEKSNRDTINNSQLISENVINLYIAYDLYVSKSNRSNCFSDEDRLFEYLYDLATEFEKLHKNEDWLEKDYIVEINEFGKKHFSELYDDSENFETELQNLLNKYNKILETGFWKDYGDFYVGIQKKEK